NFLKDGLQDLCVSRTSIKWGVPVSFDKGHVVYVWIDALSNYITALGYDGNTGTPLFDKFWPADLHMVGKEIVRFHSIIWPAILMALGLKLPKKVFGHGWLLFGGDKMSKSKGNIVDPFVLSERYGIDTLRYYLLREVPFGSDGLYTNEALLTRYNSELCNDLGNLVKRSVAMAEQYFGGQVTPKADVTEAETEIVTMIDRLSKVIEDNLKNLKINKALEDIFAVVSRANKYIDETAPWVLAKDEPNKPRLSRVMYTLLEAVRVVATALKPFLAETPYKIFAGLGEGTDLDFGKALKYGKIKNYKVKGQSPLFVRLDVKKELEELDKIAEKEAKPATQEKTEKENNGVITIDDFAKVKLLVGTVTACEKVEKADKLLKLTVDMGDHSRTVVSGIALNYTPEQMIGKRVIVVSNLAPAKLRGIESQGMILCADSADGVVVVSPESGVPNGSVVR
ncbi:MAG: methionine--tRNA ligase subunit beta, partial [Firmicutes bacterium]|nr:methionine--tRNA ligase subunit beta [Bacillota bacterium]